MTASNKTMIVPTEVELHTSARLWNR